MSLLQGCVTSIFVLRELVPELRDIHTAVTRTGLAGFWVSHQLLTVVDPFTPEIIFCHWNTYACYIIVKYILGELTDFNFLLLATYVLMITWVCQLTRDVAESGIEWMSSAPLKKKTFWWHCVPLPNTRIGKWIKALSPDATILLAYIFWRHHDPNGCNHMVKTKFDNVNQKNVQWWEAMEVD